jgi:hypothetical protein
MGQMRVERKPLIGKPVSVSGSYAAEQVFEVRAGCACESTQGPN